MGLVIYDTLARRKVPFEPAVPGHVGIYVCGPTVYADPHLGHARGPVVYDVLRRYLLHKGYKVRFVSNITDVGHLTDDADEGEDKIVRRAKLERLEPMEVAEKYTWSYFDAMQALNVLRPSIAPRASGHIPEMLELTERLLARGWPTSGREASTSGCAPSPSTGSSQESAWRSSGRGPGWRCGRRRKTPWTSPSGRRPSPGTSCAGRAPGGRGTPAGTLSARP